MLKEIIRRILIFLHLDITKNLSYDRLTKKILKQELRLDSNCIDIGCHKGEILDLILTYAPTGKHYAFEPIPYYLNHLREKYRDHGNVFLYPYALSNTEGMSSFNFVRNAPAYSGIKQRRYDIKNPDIQEIEVELNCLDNIVEKDQRVDFIKIDVEGAEFGVLKGALQLLKEQKPTLLFECGLGGSDYYGTTPEDIYTFLVKEIGLDIYTLNDFVERNKKLEKKDFVSLFNTNKEYYFIAHK